MDVAQRAQDLLLVVLVVAAVVRTRDVAAPTVPDPDARRSVCRLAASFWLLALANGMSLPSMVALVDGATTHGIARIGFNACTMIGIGAMLAFFEGVVAPPDRGHGAARRAIAMSVAVAVTLAILSLATPVALRGSTVLDAVEHPAVLAFFLVGGSWMAYAFLRTGRLALRFARSTSGALPLACGLVAGGFLLVGLTSVLRVVIVLGVVHHAPPELLVDANRANFTANLLGQTVGAVGLSVLGLLRYLDHRRRRRLDRDLVPLWRALRRTFPDLGLPTALVDGTPDGDADMTSSRRLVEIWDGLTRLSERQRGRDAVLRDTLATLDAEDYHAAADDHGWDEAVLESHRRAVEPVGEDVGTPVVHVDGHGLFGPVLTTVPREAEALAVFDAVVTMATRPYLAELKRGPLAIDAG